jgi:hypothetical protein
MKKPSYDISQVQAFFTENRIATLSELKAVLNTASTMTVFRKLKELDYLSSYSHRGKYYTLFEIADFDDLGLWSHQSVWFSEYGNLVETAKVFVTESESGFSAQELDRILQVETKQALLNLCRKGDIYRQRISGCYIYLSAEERKQRIQVLLREDKGPLRLLPPLAPDSATDQLKAAIVLFFSLLDEKQRRLYAGLEALKLGHGGDQKVAQVFGLDAHTVARGRRELFSDDLELERVRRRGGGRKAVEKKLRKSSRISSRS